MQTILGSGGAIGTELAKALYQYTNQIRLVSRNPKKVNDSDQLFVADLTDASQINKALAGSSVCYLCVGFNYTIKAWRESWPSLIRNVVEACIRNGCKLVFFDNVYALDPDYIGNITEEVPMKPCSKKGEVRALVDRHIIENVEKGNIQAIIARSPDFFGPIKQTSALMITVYDNMIKNKAAQWLCNADVPHTMGYTLDLAKGTALLGNTDEAFNQIWNLPVDDEAPTGREWVKLFAEEMGKTQKVQVLPSWGLFTLGLFMPTMKEIYEMRYQYERPYRFNSSKFKTKFDFSPSSNKEAVKQTIETLKRTENK